MEAPRTLNPGGFRRAGNSALRRGALSALAASLAGCGSTTRPVPEGPQVSGRIHLVASLTDDGGIETGQRLVTDATGVLLQLAHGDTVVTTAYSQSGYFRFFGVAAGSYVIRLPEPALAEDTLQVTVTTNSIDRALPLRVEPSPLLLTAPNPCTRADGLAIYRSLPAAGPVSAAVLDLGFEPVWSFGPVAHPGGLFHVHWFPDVGVPAGMYWVRVSAGGIETVELVYLSS